MRDIGSLTLFFVIVLQIFPLILSSDGDRSPYYQKCVKGCTTANCTTDSAFTTSSAELQDKWSRLLFWNCKDECRYHCMWKTVLGYQERGYDIPKFHGKWPFKRFLGIQEPAAAFSSLLNLATHMYMYLEIVRRFSVKVMPVVILWHVFAMVCMHAWTWSAIFHTRDTAFTEFMDYACALSMVLSLFIAAIVRVFHRSRKLVASVVLLALLYYCEHVRYLRAGRVDYDYNMLVNVFFGVLGSVLWLAWAGGQLAAGRRHAWRLGAFTLASGAALALELLDFPPRANAWDAHALWHLSTAPLPLLFYRFVIDDLNYLRSPASEKSDIKIT